jgi:DNA-binding response OmpR family regulator
METIFIVEDDRSDRNILTHEFQCAGYGVEVYDDGCSAMNAFRKETPAAVILDLVFPVVSGKDICREIRRESPYLPVIVVSVRTNEIDKVVLLELGADDYVTKPFNPIELLARVKAAIRRAHRASSRNWGALDQIQFGEASVDFTRMQASVSGSPVHLTVHEFKLFKFLVQHVDRNVHRSEILTEVLGYNISASTRAIDNLVLKLRQKLERDPANPVHILTVRGLGYKFAP